MPIRFGTDNSSTFLGDFCLITRWNFLLSPTDLYRGGFSSLATS